MAIAFITISALGVVVFFSAGAWPVGILFAGLTAVYVSEFFASFRIVRHRAAAQRARWCTSAGRLCAHSSGVSSFVGAHDDRGRVVVAVDRAETCVHGILLAGRLQL
jgi:hypothetical protein